MKSKKARRDDMMVESSNKKLKQENIKKDKLN